MPAIQVPQNLEEMINNRQRYNPDCLRAAKALARTKPWQGSFEKCFGDIDTCLQALCAAYDVEPIKLAHKGPRSGLSAASHYNPSTRTLVLTGHLSVVSMLNLFAQARFGSRNAREMVFAIRWAGTLFHRCFPISFARCRVMDGLLINDNRRDD